MTEALPEILALLLDRGDLSLDQLRKIAFGSPTEKTATVCPPEKPAPKPPKSRRKGHGRRAAKAYTGAQRTQVAHPTLKPGDVCPNCEKGKLRLQRDPATAILLQGQPPVTATVYEMQVLRCQLASVSVVFSSPQVRPACRVRETGWALA